MYLKNTNQRNLYIKFVNHIAIQTSTKSYSTNSQDGFSAEFLSFSINEKSIKFHLPLNIAFILNNKFILKKILF